MLCLLIAVYPSFNGRGRQATIMLKESYFALQPNFPGCCWITPPDIIGSNRLVKAILKIAASGLNRYGMPAYLISSLRRLFHGTQPGT